MTLKHYDMEGGTDGAAATATLTGASLMNNPNSEGTMTFRAGSKNSGALGVRLAAGAGNDITTRWASNAPNYRAAFAFNIRLLAIPTSQKILATLRHLTGIAWRLSIRPNGGLYTDGSEVTGDTSVGVTLSVNQWYRVEALVDVVNGTCKVMVYPGNGLTALVPEHSQEGMLLGSAEIVAADIFANRGTTVDLDDVRLDDGSISYLGPALSTKPAAATVRPWDLVENAGAYTSIGTTDHVTAVADNSDSTYVQSVSSPVNTPIMFALEPMTLGPITVTVRHNATSASPVITRTIRLYQGSTLIAQRAVTLPTTITDYSFTTTTSETNQMNWPRNNLYVEIRDSAL